MYSFHTVTKPAVCLPNVGLRALYSRTTGQIRICSPRRTMPSNSFSSKQPRETRWTTAYTSASCNGSVLLLVMRLYLLEMC